MIGVSRDYWTVYPLAVERAKAVITVADIQQAVEDYQRGFNTMPKFVALNPKNSGLAIPEGLELRTVGGCMAWEIWLAESYPLPTPKVVQDAVLSAGEGLSVAENHVTKLPAMEMVGGSSFVTQPKASVKHAGGRPRKQDGEAVSRMTEWRRQKAEQGVLL